jgi:hypothetical protein
MKKPYPILPWIRAGRPTGEYGTLFLGFPFSADFDILTLIK